MHVDLDQARGRDLVVKHSERVEQEVLRILTNADLKKNRRYLVNDSITSYLTIILPHILDSVSCLGGTKNLLLQLSQNVLRIREAYVFITLHIFVEHGMKKVSTHFFHIICHG